jgi:hypothetical protein
MRGHNAPRGRSGWGDQNAAVSTLDFRWHGEITFWRAYACTPNGRRLPEELNST